MLHKIGSTEKYHSWAIFYDLGDFLLRLFRHTGSDFELTSVFNSELTKLEKARAQARFTSDPCRR